MAILTDRQAYLRELDQKIKTLQFLGKHLDDARVRIEFTYSCGSRAVVDQSLIPFNLAMELRVLIGDSIDYYQRVIVNVNTIPDEIG
jgi:hypothetical protein